jgi:hypothetical protein
MKLLNTIWQFMIGLSEASYAAHLARNQQWDKAKSMYQR